MKKNLEVTSWYNHPEWFEIGFEKDTNRECDFFEAASKKYGKVPLRRVFEPACGSGRLVTEMAARGYQVTGFDLSEPSLEYLRKRLKKRRLKADVFQGDMSNFQLRGKFDAGFCTFNSFRHLNTEKESRGLLQCVAKSLNAGGLFFLGLHLAPPDAEPLCIERWFGERGNIKVTTTLRVTASSRKTRLERLRINVLVREFENRHASNGHARGAANRNGKATANGTLKLTGPSKIVGRMQDEFDYRMYTAAQIRELIASVPHLEIVETFDFWYNLNDPQKLDNDAIDVLFVLRRR
jgi:SAM-dependent methyltransferase